jgi:hypothetical protein
MADDDPFPGPSAIPELPAEFPLLYDAVELALIERQRVVERVDEARRPKTEADPADLQGDDGLAPGLTTGGLVRRYGVLGAMGARSMLGVGEVIEPAKAKPTVIEFAPDRLNEAEQLVTFVLVPGDPQASRLIIRPWLRRWSA